MHLAARAPHGSLSACVGRDRHVGGLRHWRTMSEIVSENEHSPRALDQDARAHGAPGSRSKRERSGVVPHAYHIPRWAAPSERMSAGKRFVHACARRHATAGSWPSAHTLACVRGAVSLFLGWLHPCRGNGRPCPCHERGREGGRERERASAQVHAQLWSSPRAG